MEKNRRELRGRPLLVASAGLVLAVGCHPAPRGNLMAPPTVELCVTAEPAEAKVQVNGEDLPDGGCARVYQGAVEISASAQGYQPLNEQLTVSGPTKHTVRLSKGEPTPTPAP
jgi:hypothetical protein